MIWNSRPTAMPFVYESTEVSELLHQGELLALPTESSFCLAARIDRPRALRKLFELKRERRKPIPLVIASASLLPLYVEEIPPWAEALMKRFWPGALTLVFSASSRIPEEVHQGTKSVGIRQPGEANLLALLSQVQVPLTATSANLPGEPPLTRAEDLERVFPDLYIWGVVPETPGGPPSTLVDVRTPELKILRPGRIPVAELSPFLSPSPPGNTP